MRAVPLWTLLVAMATVPPPSAPPPNVVVVLIDDLGWKDLGATGSTRHLTPHLDALAARGVNFPQAYASAPNCAPTRACLMTGQYPPRHGVYTVGDSWGGDRARRKLAVPENREELPGPAVTLAEAYRAAGYATCCVGKWNLGTARDPQHAPTAQGFDEFRHYRDMGFRDGYFDAQRRYSTDVLFASAAQFVAQSKARPFFLFLSPDAVHTPLQAPDDAIAAAKARGLEGDAATYAAMVERVDAGMGLLMAELRRQGIDERTVVVFTSDNGGDVSDNAPLNGKKGRLYEGGIRVPLLIAGPGVNAGLRPALPVNTVDLFPTLLGLCGVPLPKVAPGLDGVDLRPSLRGQAQTRPAMFFHFPAYIGQGEPSAAVRDGSLKLLRLYESRRDELYDLAADPGERVDLAEREPQARARLAQLLESWQRDVQAPIPSAPNPDYDPNAPRQRGGGQARREQQRQRPGRGGGNAGGDSAGGNSGRQPWIVAHARELDADHDGVLTEAELRGDLAATLRGYDRDGDGAVSATERGARPRTALAGFVDQHASELDGDGDGVITAAELEATALRMFRRADQDGDGKVAVPAAVEPPTRPAAPAPPAGPSRSTQPEPALAKVFAAFGAKLRVRWDDDYLYVEGDAMPDHPIAACGRNQRLRVGASRRPEWAAGSFVAGASGAARAWRA